MDYNKIFPEINGFLIRPVIAKPPLCTLAELQDGTYNIQDLEKLNQILEIREHINRASE